MNGRKTCRALFTGSGTEQGSGFDHPVVSKVCRFQEQTGCAWFIGICPVGPFSKVPPVSINSDHP
eukprot:3266342-Amphidinium_carterae.2